MRIHQIMEAYRGELFVANIGISCACLYPSETEGAVREIAELGVKNIEVHFSAYCELEGDILRDIRNTVESCDMNVNSVHPFFCVLESPMFFSDYNDRRFNDGLEIYKKYFNATAEIGGKYLVFHGGQLFGVNRCTVSDEEYIERYHKIFECGRSFGVTLTHENVYTHTCGSIDFCRKMIDALGDDALFTFDNKQARRSGFSAVEFASALSGHVRNVHISDFDPEHDCILPGKGVEDFQGIYNALGDDAENTCWMLEIYRNAFSNAAELKTAAEYLKNLLG